MEISKVKCIIELDNIKHKGAIQLLFCGFFSSKRGYPRKSVICFVAKTTFQVSAQI